MTRAANRETPYSIGQRIRELRQNRKISQVELARRIGCAQNTIAGWESNPARSPHKRFIGKVAQALNVSVDYLLDIKKTENTPIPCYGTFPSTGFAWSTEPQEYIDVAPGEYVIGRFAIKIADDFLEPTIIAGDYAIFEKIAPEDADIVVVRLPEKENKAMVKKWRRQQKIVALLENNPNKVCPPYCFQIYQEFDDSLIYLTNSKPKEHLIVEGKLVGIKRKIKTLNCYTSIG